VGVGISNLNTSLDNTSGESTSKSTTQTTVDGGAGVAVKVGPVKGLPRRALEQCHEQRRAHRLRQRADGARDARRRPFLRVIAKAALPREGRRLFHSIPSCCLRPSGL
jgi:hypothetical protein